VLDIGKVNRPTFVSIGDVGDFDLIGSFVVRLGGDSGHVKETELLPGHRRTGIAGGNQFLQAQEIKVQRKVFEKIALVGVIRITEDDLITEVISVVAQLGFYIGKLSVELVTLSSLCSV